MIADNQAAASHAAWARAALRRLFARSWGQLSPPPPLDPARWATKYRILSPEESALPGRFKWEVSPALREIAVVAGLRTTRKIVVQKSAQVGYTAGIVCNIIGYNVHYRPSVIVAAFPRAQAAKDFAAEKLDPMIQATPVLSTRITLKSRAQGNSTLRKRFPGGLAKLVGTNSPSDVKSTSARVVIVEEPDDVSGDVKGQGNSVKLLEERAKTYPDHLIVIGGTPTAKNASVVEDEMKKTDQRCFHVPCHSCGDSHVPSWDHVTIPGLALSDEDLALPVDELQAKWPMREIYGRARWEDAFYTCPHCGTIWTDEERVGNLRRAEAAGGGWIATAQSETPGFYLNELLSTFEGSYVPVLARKYLEAKHKMDEGDPKDMVAFWNSTLGLPWEYRGELPEEEELRNRAEDYLEWHSPAGGLEALMAVDVQHDRLAVEVWTVGAGEEMWLAYWGELYGQTVVAHQGAWVELEQLLNRRVRHACGAGMPIAAAAIDSSDGQTNDAVYAFVRKHHRHDRQVLAVKGAPDSVGRVEIWTPPKAIDPNARSTKASKLGVLVHIVGTAKAKDLILGWSEHAGRVRLTGNGPARMHWYRGVRDDFFEQLLGALKVPSKKNPKVRNWVDRKDRRNEALDCAVYVLWLCRHLRLHLRKPAQWRLAELRLRQQPLLPVDELAMPPEPIASSWVTEAPESGTKRPAAETVAPVPATPSPADAAPAEPPAPAPAAAPAPRPAPRRVVIGNEDWSRRL